MHRACPSLPWRRSQPQVLPGSSLGLPPFTGGSKTPCTALSAELRAQGPNVSATWVWALSRAGHPYRCPSLRFTSRQTFFFLASSNLPPPSSLFSRQAFLTTTLHPISRIPYSSASPCATPTAVDISTSALNAFSPSSAFSRVSPCSPYFIHPPLCHGGTFWSVFQCVLKTDFAWLRNSSSCSFPFLLRSPTFGNMNGVTAAAKQSQPDSMLRCPSWDYRRIL